MVEVGSIYYMVMPHATGFAVESMYCSDQYEADTANYYNSFCFESKSEAEALELALQEAMDNHFLSDPS